MLYLITRLGLPPLILAHVSLADYGLWSACFILIGYIGVADFGFSSVYVRSAARLHEAGDTAGIGRLLSTGIACMLVVSALLFSMIAAALPWVMDALKIPAADRASAQALILGSSGVFFIDMSLNAFAYVLHGVRRFRAEQHVWVLAFLVELALIAILLVAGAGLHALLAAFALRYLLSIACNIRLAFIALPGLQVGPRGFDRSLLPHFLKFGMAVQASTLFSMALHSADRLLAGALIGPHAIALMDLGAKLPVSATSIPGAIAQVTLPAAARLQEAHAALQSLYQRATRAVALVAAVPLGFIAAFASPLCLAWLGPRPELAVLPALVALSAGGALAHIITGPGSSVFRARGHVGNDFIYHGLRLVCIGAGLVISHTLAGNDVRALAVGLAAAAVVASLCYLAHNHHRLGLPLRGLVTHILAPAAAVLAPAFALAQVWGQLAISSAGRWETLAALMMFGVLDCLLTAAVIGWLLDPAERRHVAALLARCGLGRFALNPPAS